MSPALLFWALVAAQGHAANAGALPMCSNAVIVQVVKRAGCTLGDGRCWNRKGGFCGDHVEARVKAQLRGAPMERVEVQPREVQPGDIATFVGRAHYALVEAVHRGPDGQPVAVDVSEYNFGTCWVDKDAMVTDQYLLLGHRTVPLREVDGGFSRARLVDAGVPGTRR